MFSKKNSLRSITEEADMKVTVAIDSFKGSLSSMEAGNAVRTGIRRVYPDALVEVRPLADGGEGTVDALAAGMNGVIHEISVTGPLANRLQPVTVSLKAHIRRLWNVSGCGHYVGACGKREIRCSPLPME